MRRLPGPFVNAGRARQSRDIYRSRMMSAIAYELAPRDGGISRSKISFFADAT